MRQAKQYEVYLHIHDGTVFYVGKGLRGRAFSQHGRNKSWWEVVALYPDYTVAIVLTTPWDGTACALELELIMALEPSCNLVINPRYSPVYRRIKAKWARIPHHDQGPTHAT